VSLNSTIGLNGFEKTVIVAGSQHTEELDRKIKCKKILLYLTL